MRTVIDFAEEKGAERLAKLIILLLRENNISDIELVVEDETARKNMYKKYGLPDTWQEYTVL